jgi:hypothetical protein
MRAKHAVHVKAQTHLAEVLHRQAGEQRGQLTASLADADHLRRTAQELRAQIAAAEAQVRDHAAGPPTRALLSVMRS